MSNNNASATRKRRSSILKTKPRAPLSELEFNPTTPEAATKSRRVSFSRKKDVAEFVVNEATTTWRNFYEEQNRTLESSGNESEIRPSAVKQFHEVEAEMDHTTLGKPMGSRANLTLFSDMNFTEQLASLDCITADNCLKAPTQNREPSIMVENSKVFGDSFANPLIVEHTGRIELDFSEIQQATATGVEEQNLSDIAKEVERANPNIAGQNCFLNDFNNKSYYVEVDLNETKGVGRNDISDMSITDIIHTSVIDKENIAVDSLYRPSSEECQKHLEESVLIFDGKKLKVANMHDKLDDILDDLLPEKQLNSACIKVISNSSKLDPELETNASNRLSDEGVLGLSFETNNYSDNENISQPNKTDMKHTNRKTLISHQMSMMMDLSIDNCFENPNIKLTNNFLGMPSFIEKPLGYSQGNCKDALLIAEKKQASNQSVSCSDLLENTKTQNTRPVSCIDSQNQDDDIYIEKGTSDLQSQDVNKNQFDSGKPIELFKKKLIILNHDDDLPNFTLDVPPQFGRSKSNGHKSIIFDTEDSVSSMYTTQDILKELQEASNLYTNKNAKNSTKTIFFDNDISLSDLSMTKAVPVANLHHQQNSNTLLPEENHHSIDTIAPDSTSETKRKTIIFEKNDDLADISLTHAIQTSNKHKTLAMSMTHEKRHTIVFDKHDVLANLSMTQAIPKVKCVNYENSKIECEMADLPITRAEPQLVVNEGKTISKAAPLSITEAIPQTCLNENNLRRKTIIFGKDDVLADLSITQAIPAVKCAIQEKHGTTCNVDLMSVNQTLTKSFSKEGKTISEITDMSIAQASSNGNNKKRQTIVFEKDDILADLSVTQGIPAVKSVIKKKYGTTCDMNLTSMRQAELKSVLIEGETMSEITNMSVVQESSKESNIKRQTIVFEKDDVLADVSMTLAIPAVKYDFKEKHETSCNLPLLPIHHEVPKSVSNEKMRTSEISDVFIAQASSNEDNKKGHTIVFDKDDVLADVSMTLDIPSVKCAIQEKYGSTCNMDPMSMHQTLPKSASKEGKTISEITDMTIAQASSNERNKKRQTILFDKGDILADLSMTQTIPPVICGIQEEHGTRCNMDLITMHQAIPKSVLKEGNTKSKITDMSVVQTSSNENYIKRQTIVFDKDDLLADVSMTLAIPSVKYAIKEKHETSCNLPLISIHQARPKSVSNEEKTSSEILNISVAQASSVESNTKRQTIVFDKDDVLADLSITQAFPCIKGAMQENHKTLCNLGDVSMHQAVPQFVAIEKNNMSVTSDITMVQVSSNESIENRQTIVFDKDDVLADLSITQAFPCIKGAIKEKEKAICNLVDVSMHRSVPQFVSNKRKHVAETTVITMAQVSSKDNNKKRQTIVFDNDDTSADLSITQAIPTTKVMTTKVMMQEKIEPECSKVFYAQEAPEEPQLVTNEDKMILEKTGYENRQTNMFDTSNALDDLSFTQAILRAEPLNQEVQRAEYTVDDMAMTNTLPQSVANKHKGRTILFNKECDANKVDVSLTEMITSKLNPIDEMTHTPALAIPQILTTELKPIGFSKNNEFTLVEEKGKTNNEIVDKPIIQTAARKFLIEDSEKKNGCEKPLTNVSQGLQATSHIHKEAFMFNEHSEFSGKTLTLAQTSEIKSTLLGSDVQTSIVTITQAIPQKVAEVNLGTKNSENDQYKTIPQQERKSCVCTNEFTFDDSKISCPSINVTREEQVIPVEHDTSLTKIALPHVVIKQNGKDTNNESISDMQIKINDQDNTSSYKCDANGKIGSMAFSNHESQIKNQYCNQNVIASQESQEMSNEIINKEINNMRDMNPPIPTDFNLQLDRLIRDSLKSENDLQKLKFIERSVASNKIIFNSVDENKKKMVDLLNLESDFNPRTDKPLADLFDCYSERSHDINKIASQSLQDAQHYDDNGMGKDTVEKHIIGDTSVIANSVGTNIRGLNKIKFDVETQSFQDQLENPSLNVTDYRNNIITEMDYQRINKTNNIGDLLTEETEKSFFKSVNKDKDCSFKTNTNTQNYEKDVSKEVKENIIKKQLTIEELLNRTERIKTLNIAVNTLEQKTMCSNNKSEDYKTKMVQNNEMQNFNISDFEINTDNRNKTLRLSKEVVKTLNFEDENIDSKKNIHSQDNIRTSLVKKGNISVDVSTKRNINNPRVIPEEYDSTLNSIKDLMKELVKPNIDLPFNTTSEKTVSKTVNSGKKTSFYNPCSEKRSNVTLDHDSQMQSADVKLLESQYNRNEISATAREVVDKMLTVDGIVNTISQNKTLTEQSQLHWTNQIKNYVPVTNISKEVIVPEPTNNQTIIFDHSNPLNNVNLASLNHKSIDISLQNDRKFDVSNPLNNICLNVQALVPKAKGSVALGPELKSDVASTCKSTNQNEIDCNDELVDNTSCITFIDVTSDSNSSIDQLDNDSKLLSKNDSTSDTKTILRNQNIDVLYMMAKETFNDEDTADEGSKTDETTKVPTKQKEDATIEKINMPKNKFSPSSNKHTTNKSNKKCTDKDSSEEERIDEHCNINITRNDNECNGTGFFGLQKFNEKEASKKESNFISDKREFDLNQKQNNGKSENDDRIKEQIEKVTSMDVSSTTKYNEKYMTSNQSKIISPKPHDEWDSTCNRTKIDPQCIDENVNSRKRVLSAKKPDKHKDCFDKLELTPNPPRKIHKISTSPLVSCDANQKDLVFDSTITDAKTCQSLRGQIIPRNSLSKEDLMPTGKKSDVIDLELLMDTSVDKEKDNVNEKTDLSSDESMTGGCEWQEEILNAQDKLDDIVETIDELPFMGTWCCAWERAERAAWSFAVLHARVRVLVEFARDQRDARTFVPPDTPVAGVHVEPINDERGHAVAALCVRACVAALRALVAREGEVEGAGCARAADVPALLERCARAVRSAARFGRVVQDASLRLALRLSGDDVTLQVVNIPLRSMWEVSLRASLGAWPRAVGVRVTPVGAGATPTSAGAAPLDALLAAVPDGWAHLPDTIWKVFNFLKDKRKEDLSPVASKRQFT